MIPKEMKYNLHYGKTGLSPQMLSYWPFLFCNSLLFVRLWFHMWRLFCYYLFLISSSLDAVEGCASWLYHFLGVLYFRCPDVCFLMVRPKLLFWGMGMVGEACLLSNAYYPRMPEYTLYSRVHVCWSERSDSSFFTDWWVWIMARVPLPQLLFRKFVKALSPEMNWKTYDVKLAKKIFMPYANNEVPNQHVHACSLILTFCICWHILQ